MISTNKRMKFSGSCKRNKYPISFDNQCDLIQIEKQIQKKFKCCCHRYGDVSLAVQDDADEIVPMVGHPWEYFRVVHGIGISLPRVQNSIT
jgi:hypothetical protein